MPRGRTRDFLKTMNVLDLIFLIGLVKEIPDVVKLLRSVAPSLGKVPLLGKIISFIDVPQDDTQWVEEMRKASEQGKRTRRRQRDENNRYVVKVSDALDCVEKHLYDPKTAWNFIKGVVSGLAEGKGASGFSKIGDAVSECIIAASLRQDTPRTKVTRKDWPHRPSVGHGYGRPGKFPRHG